MSDDVRRLSEELARDPASLVFLQLGETLRRRGDLDMALRVSLRGLERHADNADAHDLVARIYADGGDYERALTAWDAALSRAPDHRGARKGMGYVLYRLGRWKEAERELMEAAERHGDDSSITAALTLVRRQLTGDSAPPDEEEESGLEAALVASRAEARHLFLPELGESAMTAMLIDEAGLVMAGSWVVSDGRDLSQEIGAELSGLSAEMQRAMRHLDLGEWEAVSFETEAATVSMAPSPDGGLVMVAADPDLPQGLVRRVLDRCVARALAWLTGERMPEEVPR